MSQSNELSFTASKALGGKAMTARLVVTGHRDGRSMFARDDKVESVDMAGAGYLFPFWSANELAVHPGSGENPEAPEFFPPVGGVRFFKMMLTPQDGASTVEHDESSELGGDLLGAMERDDPGMHTTDSTDFGVVTSGEVGLELDDGAEVILTAGDVVVQNGTRHRWRVIGHEAATIIFVIIGAHRA
jgi:Cupin domain